MKATYWAAKGLVGLVVLLPVTTSVMVVRASTILVILAVVSARCDQRERGCLSWTYFMFLGNRISHPHQKVWWGHLSAAVPQSRQLIQGQQCRDGQQLQGALSAFQYRRPRNGEVWQSGD